MSRRALLSACLWVVFSSGVAIEAFAPRLKIENHAFVMPPSVMRQGAQIRPDALVALERRMQWAAAILTIGGALALAFCHRRTLTGALLVRQSFDPESLRVPNHARITAANR
ncbi:MAG: hypothetical protein WB919_02380, partial [Candidatus Sulfotelmatobacter sp.]